MKQFRYYTMMILSVVLTLWSCSDDDDTTAVGAEARIALSADVLQVPAEGGSVSVTVTSDADWRLAGVCDWLHPSVTEGRSGDVVTFTADANTTGQDLIATFKFFTGASVASLTVKSVLGNTFELSSDETMNVEQAGASIYLKLKSNVTDLEVSLGGVDWLTLGERVEFAGEQVFPLTVSANDGYLMRTAEVMVSSPSIEKSVQITINQAPTEWIEVTQEDMENHSVMYDLAARTIEFQVVTNLKFAASVTSGSEWISEPQVSEPVTADNGLSTYTVSVDLIAATSTRGGVVTFTADNGMTQVVTIVQKDPNAELVEISSDFADELVEKGWIVPVGDRYVVLEAGLQATVFESSAWIYSIAGLEYFPNLEVLHFSASGLKELDISGLHKVRELDITSATNVGIFNFGDNPITSFSLSDVLYYSYARSIQFISQKLEYLDANQMYSFGYTETLDVTECPALKTLVADRCDFLETIIVREGQAIDITKPDNVNIEYR